MTYTQGFFKPKNRSKYHGDPTRIVYRSGWELRVMMKFDHDPNVIQWSSEEVVVGYISPKDGRPHRYFVDFWVRMKDGKEFLYEVKPADQTIPPKMTAKKTKRKFTNEMITYAINDAKFEAADAYAKKRGWEFKILTEYHLGLKK
jgi:hypothetical protein